MKINKRSYQIEFDDNRTLRISGNLSLSPEEYEDVENFFERIIEIVSDEKITQLVLDLRYLNIINSSGIKTICVLIIDADEIEGFPIKLLCKNDLVWQQETCPSFIKLMENIEIDFS